MGALKEHHLHDVWRRQSFPSDALLSADGQPLVVLNPGSPNHDGGPDFRNAKVRIAGTLYHGDIEIHLHVAEWLRHGHQNDPAYNRVILHVVLEGDPLQYPTVVQSGRKVTTLVIGSLVPRDETRQRSGESGRFDRQHLACASLNQDVSASVLQAWIQHLARMRLELKVRRFEERLRELAFESQLRLREDSVGYGVEDDADRRMMLTSKDLSARIHWDQVLYEGIMDGLGYAKNRAPFVRLAQALSLERIRALGVSGDPLKIEALMFGVAGLLPHVKDLKESASKDHVRVLRRTWRELRSFLSCDRLQKVDWQFFPTRPSNFPTVRIATAARIVHTILMHDMFRRLVNILKESDSTAGILSGWLSLLSTTPEPFWRSHFRFDVPSISHTGSLGRSRALDIIANTFIPLSLLYARVFHDGPVRSRTLEIYDRFPRPGPNSIVRHMEAELLRGRIPAESLAAQQGALHLWSTYCREDRCRECDIGKLVFKA